MNITQAIDKINAKDGCEWRVLQYLQENGESSKSDMSIVLPYQQDTIGTALKKLIDKGLVSRVARGRYTVRGDMNVIKE